MTEQRTFGELEDVGRRSAEWNNLRERRLELDGHECSNCGRSENLDVHHIVPVAHGGTPNLTNLVTLCIKCHDKTHEDISLPEVKRASNTRWLPTVETAARVLNTTNHPLSRVVYLLLAKTGIALRELCDLELSDIRLNDNPLDESSEFSGLARPHPDHILVSDTENKSPRGRGVRLIPTQIPIDSELRLALRRYFAIRPNSAGSEKAFLSTTSWGQPITPQMVRNYLQNMAQDAGEYETGAGATNNLTPETLKQFFEDRYMGQPAVRDYILGRKKEQPWSFDRIETDYREGVPKLTR